MKSIVKGVVSPEDFKKITQIVASNIQAAYKKYNWTISVSGVSSIIKANTDIGIIEIEMWMQKGFALMYVKVKAGKKILSGAPMSYSLDVKFTIKEIASDITAWIKKQINQELRNLQE
ncbi:MAG: hypothetical protein KJ767_00745 [Nanoarchaeota archaeon]|nr:hypothetical protein [Nanoarchaeota archaeon]